MVINLITFASILHKQASVRSSHEVILTELEKYFTVNFIDYKDIDKLSPDDFSIIFIATGGVERLVIQHFESPPRHPLGRRHAELTGRRSRNIFLAARPGNEKRDSSRRAPRDHQAYFCPAQQFRGTTQPFRHAHRRNGHSVQLARCQQCGLSACQTPLGYRVHRRLIGPHL